MKRIIIKKWNFSNENRMCFNNNYPFGPFLVFAEESIVCRGRTFTGYKYFTVLFQVNQKKKWNFVLLTWTLWGYKSFDIHECTSIALARIWGKQPTISLDIWHLCCFDILWLLSEMLQRKIKFNLVPNESIVDIDFEIQIVHGF